MNPLQVGFSSIPWTLDSSNEEQKTNNQRKRNRSLIRKKKYTQWTKEQDQFLLNGIKKFGDNWKAITKNYFTNQQGDSIRNAASCSDRYRYYWKSFYPIKEIQSILKPIQVIALRGNRDRRITNLLHIFKEKNDLIKKETNDSNPPISPSLSTSVLDLQNYPEFSNLEDVPYHFESSFSATPFIDLNKLDAFLALDNETSAYDFLKNQHDFEICDNEKINQTASDI